MGTTGSVLKSSCSAEKRPLLIHNRSGSLSVPSATISAPKYPSRPSISLSRMHEEEGEIFLRGLVPPTPEQSPEPNKKKPKKMKNYNKVDIPVVRIEQTDATRPIGSGTFNWRLAKELQDSYADAEEYSENEEDAVNDETQKEPEEQTEPENRNEPKEPENEPEEHPAVHTRSPSPTHSIRTPNHLSPDYPVPSSSGSVPIRIIKVQPRIARRRSSIDSAHLEQIQPRMLRPQTPGPNQRIIRVRPARMTYIRQEPESTSQDPAPATSSSRLELPGPSKTFQERASQATQKSLNPSKPVQISPNPAPETAKTSPGPRKPVQISPNPAPSRQVNRLEPPQAQKSYTDFAPKTTEKSLKLPKPIQSSQDVARSTHSRILYPPSPLRTSQNPSPIAPVENPIPKPAEPVRLFHQSRIIHVRSISDIALANQLQDAGSGPDDSIDSADSTPPDTPVSFRTAYVPPSLYPTVPNPTKKVKEAPPMTCCDRITNFMCCGMRSRRVVDTSDSN